MKAARQFVESEYGSDYLPPKPIQYGPKKKAQDAHEAIRPTSIDLPPEKVKKSLTPQQFKLYKLIWNRFLASQMAPARYATETVDITAGEYLLRATAQKLTFDGFLKVYQAAKESEDNGNGNGNGVESLPELSIDENLELVRLGESDRRRLAYSWWDADADLPERLHKLRPLYFAIYGDPTA